MNPGINEVAASWDARLRSHTCTQRDRVAFRAWCDADLRNQQAFDRLQSALSALRRAANQPQLRALRERGEVMTGRSVMRRAFVRVSAVAGIAAISFMIAVLVRHRPPALFIGSDTAVRPQEAIGAHAEQVYSTGLLERRTLSLPDGSSATLDAATRLETHWLAHERRIRLVSGQVFFRVSKDPARPFVVIVGDRTVTALGTAFDVRLDADKVQVTLLEGRVAVRGIGHAARQPTLELAPSEQLVAIDGEMPTVRVVDVRSSTGWADGQVFFIDEALPVAVASMNRYSSQKILVADPTLARYRVNGMFRSGNQEGFVGALTTYYPIDAHRDSQGRIVLLHRLEESGKR